MLPSHPSLPSHSISPSYTSRLFTTPVPALRLPEESMDPDAAYRAHLIGVLAKRAVAAAG